MGGAMEGGGSGEDRLIARFFRPIAGAGALGLRDDAALLSPPEGCDLVLTKDAVVAGVHFFADDAPASVARKALRVNLSDLAAKGAAPLGALLALALPKGTGEAWVAAFADGLGADAVAFGCPILGGDTVATPGPVTITITALGAVPKGGFVPRTGARPGQAILVSGTIGDAALGLKLRQGPNDVPFGDLDAEQRGHLLDRYLHPQPRLALAPVLRAYAAAAMDVSDGLAGDAAKMLAASGCGGVIEARRVPLSAAAARVTAGRAELLRTALTGGDDYEILACVPHAAVPAFTAEAARAGVPVTLIGETRGGEGLDVIGPDGVALDLGSGSFSHF
ncbi:thiamine-phosphate kinase [Xanthobacter tagetidis]|jgi:thiamine-monophosphate kinase|nr:thiamine-phosphate kinase [Xanthobacter tagetidis]MBB6309615.1 thiamine-monophosphate kinase [Xanthobacter tagetidis]